MATVAVFRAHPDDEVILTGGTLARAVAAGHRVVLVTATDGRVHNADDDFRLNELRSSARVLGIHRVECLGYADSGTMPRELLCRIAHLARLPRLPAPYELDVASAAYAPRATITHRINVFRFARHKRDPFAAHRSQIGSSGCAHVCGASPPSPSGVRPGFSP